MEKRTKLAQGAEACIFLEEGKDGAIVKHRLKKSYRHPQIDEELRKSRTRRETTVLKKLEEIGFPAPHLHGVDLVTKEIRMQYLKGKRVCDILHEDHILYSKEIGRKVAVLHMNDIIHGDLTTSNMIQDGEIRFIDFGLSQFSEKAEHKAVDLYLLERALESRHHAIFEECFGEILKEYRKRYKDAPAVLKRFEEVKKRGRYKNSY